MSKEISEKEIAEGFGQGFDCSMATLYRLAEDVGLTEEQGKKLSSCFGVGMMQGTVCGAVTGAFIAIGYKYGNTEPDDMAQKALCISKREEFVKKFTDKHGSIMCPVLMEGLDFRNPDDMAKARERGLMVNKCPKLCKDAILITRELLK